jgi:hypothetical protein
MSEEDIEERVRETYLKGIEVGRSQVLREVLDKQRGDKERLEKYWADQEVRSGIPWY